jgi:hypothetical protein
MRPLNETEIAVVTRAIERAEKKGEKTTLGVHNLDALNVGYFHDSMGFTVARVSLDSATEFVGVSKRNARDVENPERGEMIALLRAVKDSPVAF